MEQNFLKDMDSSGRRPTAYLVCPDDIVGPLLRWPVMDGCVTRSPPGRTISRPQPRADVIIHIERPAHATAVYSIDITF
jgi:hypothetical protein